MDLLEISLNKEVEISTFKRKKSDENTRHILNSKWNVSLVTYNKGTDTLEKYQDFSSDITILRLNEKVNMLVIVFSSNSKDNIIIDEEHLVQTITIKVDNKIIGNIKFTNEKGDYNQEFKTCPYYKSKTKSDCYCVTAEKNINLRLHVHVKENILSNIQYECNYDDLEYIFFSLFKKKKI